MNDTLFFISAETASILIPKLAKHGWEFKQKELANMYVANVLTNFKIDDEAKFKNIVISTILASDVDNYPVLR